MLVVCRDLWWRDFNRVLIDKRTNGALCLFPENRAGVVVLSLISVLRSGARKR